MPKLMPSTGRCYYDNDACDYSEGLWLCLSCNDWYCHGHNHETSKGYNVECVGCEAERKMEEAND